MNGQVRRRNRRRVAHSVVAIDASHRLLDRGVLFGTKLFGGHTNCAQLSCGLDTEQLELTSRTEQIFD